MTHPSNANVLVLFGITGDLGKKKLFPAIVELARAGLLDGPVIGVGRSDHSDDDLWDMLVGATDESARGLKSTLDLAYCKGDSTETDVYDRIAARVEEQDRVVVYTALPPSLFAGVAEQVGSSAFADRARLVLEKPFGNDRASACELFSAVTKAIDSERVFAVDHFLAKAEVEHLARFRYANPIIDAAFDRNHVDRIEVTMAEAFGVDGRGSFYDSVGALRDVVQNHLLQLIAVLLMDEPADDSAAAFDETRADLLRAMEPLDPASVVLGQFDGYLDIEGVAEDSTVETFVAAKLHVDNARWKGVDIHLRTGKELESSVTEVKVCLGANSIRFGIKPDTAIVLELQVDDEPTEVAVCGPRGHTVGEGGVLASGLDKGGPLGDYATMFAGALSDDHRHFARIADIERAWEIVDPVLDRDHAPTIYPRGSAGPLVRFGPDSTGEDRQS